MTVTIPAGATIVLADLRSKDGHFLSKPERIFDPTTGNDIGFKLRVYAKTPGEEYSGKKAMFVFRNDTKRVYIYQIWEAWRTDEEIEEDRKASEDLKTKGYCSSRSRMFYGEPHGPGIDYPYETRDFPIAEFDYADDLRGVVAEYSIFEYVDSGFAKQTGEKVVRKREVMNVRYDLATEKLDIDYYG